MNRLLFTIFSIKYPIIISPEKRREEKTLSYYLYILAFSIITILTVTCWLLFLRDYFLFDRLTTPFFSFDKIAGHLTSPTIKRTIIIFTILPLLYAAMLFILHRFSKVPSIVKILILLCIGFSVLINVFIYPVGALDVFNYLIELKLTFFYHQNPYLVTFLQYLPDPFARYAFFLDTKLFYGPSWLAIAHIPLLISGFHTVSSSLVAYKIMNALFFLLTGFIIYAYHENTNRRWRAIYLFLGNPLVIFEVITNAHNDIFTAFFLLGALLAFQRKAWLAGPFITTATLIKFFTLPIIPVFLAGMIIQRWQLKKIFFTLSSSIFLLIFFTLPFWAQRKMVDGMREGIITSQNMFSVSILSLLKEYSTQNQFFLDTQDIMKAVLGILALCMLVLLYKLLRGKSIESTIADSLLVFIITVSLFFPWYLIPVIGILCLIFSNNIVRLVYIVTATTLGLLYYPLSVWAWFQTGWSTFNIHVFQSIFLTVPAALFLLWDLFAKDAQRLFHFIVAARNDT